MDDISEKEELEQLEEGLAHELERPLTDEEEEQIKADTPEVEHSDDTLQSPTMQQFIKDEIPVLPYCGCEPLHCYLQPQRPLSEIQISSVSNDQEIFCLFFFFLLVLLLELCLLLVLLLELYL